MVRLRVVFLLNLSIHVIQRRVSFLLLIDLLIRKGNRHHGTCEIQQIHRRRIAIVLEAVVANGCRRRDRRDDGIEGLAVSKTGLSLAPLRQVFRLEGPFLEMDVPELV